MFDNNPDDDLEELQELMEEYKDKEEQDQEQETEKQVEEEEEEEASETAGQFVRVSKKKQIMEISMDKVIFGDKPGLIKNMQLAVGKIKEEEEDTDEEESKAENSGKKRKPVWDDLDDNELELGTVKVPKLAFKHISQEKSYKDFLVGRFSRAIAQPKWAQLERKDANKQLDSDDEELLSSVGFTHKDVATKTLNAKHLEYRTLRDLNASSAYAEGPIRSVQFHPSSTAALVAGESGVASIYAVDGAQNEKLHNIYFENFPIMHARITPCGTKAFFSSGKNYYYRYDLLLGKEVKFPICKKIKYINKFEVSPCGRYLAFATRNGLWHLFDAVCNELIHTFQQEHSVPNLIFTADSKQVICTSSTSKVCVYSMRQRKLEHDFMDEGCINGNVLALAPNQRLLATGSREGVVNVYDYEKTLISGAPLPEKRFLNLSTGITCVQFNHTSEILAMSSNMVKSAVRLAHFPSATVFANFPNEQLQLGKLNLVDFSPNSGYFALGGFDKKVKLFRLKHFNNY